MSEERIISAAIYYKGAIISLPAPARHHHILLTIAKEWEKNAIEIGEPDNQGFITSTGRYVNRIEAWTLAFQAEQLLNTDRHQLLFSEDVW